MLENKGILIIRYNKTLQNKIDLNLRDYINISSRIEIEIYYFIQINDKIKKINVIIEYENLSFNNIGLFEGYNYIRKINFIKFKKRK